MNARNLEGCVGAEFTAVAFGIQLPLCNEWSGGASRKHQGGDADEDLGLPSRSLEGVDASSGCGVRDGSGIHLEVKVPLPAVKVPRRRRHLLVQSIRHRYTSSPTTDLLNLERIWIWRGVYSPELIRLDPHRKQCEKCDTDS